MSLNHGGQKLGAGGATGGDDRRGLTRLHATPERKIAGGAFFKVVPDADLASRFSTGDDLEQERVARTRANDKFAYARRQTLLDHGDCLAPSVHGS